MQMFSALYTALTGMTAQQMQVDVIGNNLANSNTVGFRASRSLFSTQFSQLVSMGTAPSATNCGTNPLQIGMGTIVGSTVADFGQGSFQTTGGASDLAIAGNGLFCVQDPSGNTLYTRNGAFLLDSAANLVTAQGYAVQGYQVDSDFNIQNGTVGNLSIPLGTLSLAQATSSASLAGNLNASGTVASQGSILTSQALTNGASGPAITSGTTLTSVYDGTTALFSVGDVVTLSAKKGGRQLEAKTFTVSATQTVNDLLSFLNGALGIQTSAGVPGSPGATVDANGKITVAGNYGTVNDLSIASGALTSTGSTTNPLTFASTQTANGTSVYTSFVAYDSLGNEVKVGVTAVLETSSSTGNTFRLYVDSPDDTDASICVGTGTLTFNSQGQLASSTGLTFEIDRAGVGSATPMSITLDADAMTGLASSTSQLSVSEQNGAPEGTLSSFNVDGEGIIQGTFDNGLVRKLGQVVLAQFVNPQGLVSVGGTMFQTAPNSGSPMLAAPNTMGVGEITAGAVELSNTDVTQSFVDLMLASAGFTASSRLISTADEMLAEILAATR